MIRPDLWPALEQRGPRIHAVSNLVTANDCANLLLAVGAKPIMAQAPQEAAEITAGCDVTVLNLGTPDEDKFRACALAGREANRLGHPLILDPVGVGASRYRLERTRALLGEIRPSLIHLNLGELQALLGLDSQAQGVDSPAAHGAQSLEQAAALARRLSCAVLLSGEEDLVTDGDRAVVLTGGSPRLRRITGAGCMLSVLCGALAALTDPMTAAVNASWGWKACARRAEEQIRPLGGLGQLHMALMDQAGALSDRPPETGAPGMAWQEI
ncbi:MAG: hydroxyethylthiazole kinase [Candidatus Onthomonas sp.]